MSQANMDLGILQETKIIDGIYTRGLAGYSAIATDAPSQRRGGVALFYRSKPHFVVEAVERFGPNVLGLQVVTGERRWYIVGAYIAPEDDETMERVVAAIGKKPQGVELMVAGDFNADIKAPEGNRRAENIATDIETTGLEDMAQHFMPRRRRCNRDRRTWEMRQKGQVVRSRTDYILETDSRLFKNVAVRDPRHNSYHYMVLGCLPSAPLLVTKQYLGGQKRWPVRPPTEPSQTDTPFAALRRSVPKPTPREVR